MKSISINSPTELGDLAQQLLTFANGNKFFVFEGEMAAGKTTFIKAFCEALGVEDVVSSPTFSIINEYEGKDGLSIYHMDWYRLRNAEDAFEAEYGERGS